MNLRDLQAFLAVVETGSIVGASARLHLTQPGITRRIQSLEEGLGSLLLDRASKPFKPTAAGLTVYEHGRRVVRVLDDLHDALAAGDAIGGEFRIGVTPSLAETALAAPLDRMRGMFPDLMVRVTAGWPDQLVRQLHAGEIDSAAFSLPMGSEPPAELDGVMFAEMALHIVAARGTIVTERPSILELAETPWIINQDGCGFRTVLKRRLAQDNLPLNVGVEALSTDLRLSLVARGMGLTLASKRAIEGHPQRDGLVIVDVRDFAPRVGVWIVHRPPIGRLARPLDCLRDAMGESLAC